ncbi:uncharacterized protein LODBEIA_P17760 [Lodderomyces beijingensis]|uniref:Transcription elongation factor 1 homolog n=1 Tax=Lodderomyces beijingensis TaxID=1775926 RepID=A0ABP0ZJD6_9ASCO
MGKRKTAARKPTKKEKRTLDTQFTCLFCNHEKSVICTLDKRNQLGELHCKICGQNFQTSINALSQAVDVYSDWIDACEDLAEEAEKRQDEYDDEDDEDGERGDGDGEGEDGKEDEGEENGRAAYKGREVIDSDEEDY